MNDSTSPLMVVDCCSGGVGAFGVGEDTSEGFGGFGEFGEFGGFGLFGLLGGLGELGCCGKLSMRHINVLFTRLMRQLLTEIGNDWEYTHVTFCAAACDIHINNSSNIRIYIHSCMFSMLNGDLFVFLNNMQ
jgi:hypothetical protein